MTTAKPRWRQAAFWGNAVVLGLLSLAAAALASLQAGDWWVASPLAARWTGAGTSVVAYALFCGAILWRSRVPTQIEEASVTGAPQPCVLVVHASQTGFAQQLAERSAESLRQAGLRVQVRSISEVDTGMLASCGRALFVASTTGEGDPPDQALGFVREVMARPAALQQLRYAVLALGDREYDSFCAFGHQLDDWLRRHGAQSLFDIVEVDNADESALRHWQHHLGQLGGVTDLPDWMPASYESWTLLERRQLNLGSVGGAAFHLALAPPAGTAPRWAAGDIAEIGPRHSPQAVAELLAGAGLDDTSIATSQGARWLSDLLGASHLPSAHEIGGLDALALAARLQPLPHREYSIASLPSDGSLQLLLRRLPGPDGKPGIGSGWLCDYAQVGGEIALRVRSNPNFHAPDPARPMILIGNGTGMAGLRAHLKQRIAAGAVRNWLLFGERNADRDFFHGDEIRQWQAQGWLERVDLAFSRDPPEPHYVQEKLQDAAESLRQWVDAGASIYVCGSLAGMAPGVDAVLRQVLGDGEVERMLADRRYRRDVY